jgi:hypothetical protein
MYSNRIPLLIRPCLQETWAALQQQETQLEQPSGAVQLAHEVSAQPQVEQEPDAICDIQVACCQLILVYLLKELPSIFGKCDWTILKWVPQRKRLNFDLD